MPAKGNGLYWPYFCILKSYQRTLGKQELPPNGSMTRMVLKWALHVPLNKDLVILEILHGHVYLF